MAVSKVATFSFNNQVRGDYTSYYFRKKLFWGSLGKRVISDFATTPGNKITLPIFASMGAAEKPAEDDRLTPDSMGDKSIETQVYEVGKAWGITDAGRYRKGSNDEQWEMESSRQAAWRLAEQVDADALACLNNDGTNSIDGATGNDPAGHDELDETTDVTLTTAFTGEKGADDARFTAQRANLRYMQKGFTHLFGDRNREANLMVMHSRCYTDTLLDQGAGIMKADAVTPLATTVQGYAGNFLGKDTFENDNISKGPNRTFTDSGGATQKYVTRKIFILKPNAYIVVIKQRPKFESARDILGRIDINAVTQWFTFYPLHKQNNTDDIRAGALVRLTDEQTT